MEATDHTFIIPAYKESVYLEDCIKSLQSQTVPSQIIITTSTPTKSISEIAMRYKVPLVINDLHEGIAGDWNFAYALCKSDFLTLAHQDDMYLPSYTEICLALAQKKNNKDCLIIFTDYQEYTDNIRRKVSPIIGIKKILLFPFLFHSSIRSTFFKKLVLAFGNPICCPSVMFNRKNIGSFTFSEVYRYNTDWEAWLRLSKMGGSFIYVKKKLMVHRLHMESQTSIQIESKNRQLEEEKIFYQIWNKQIAKFFMSIYKYSSAFNKKGLQNSRL